MACEINISHGCPEKIEYPSLLSLDRQFNPLRGAPKCTPPRIRGFTLFPNRQNTVRRGMTQVLGMNLSIPFKELNTLDSFWTPFPPFISLRPPCQIGDGFLGVHSLRRLACEASAWEAPCSTPMLPAFSCSERPLLRLKSDSFSRGLRRRNPRPGPCGLESPGANACNWHGIWTEGSMAPNMKPRQLEARTKACGINTYAICHTNHLVLTEKRASAAA